MPRTDPPVITAIFKGILVIQFVQPFSTLHKRKFSAKTNLLFSMMFIQRPCRPENDETLIKTLITLRSILSVSGLPVQTSRGPSISSVPFESAVFAFRFPLPPLLRGNDAEPRLLPIRQQFPSLMWILETVSQLTITSKHPQPRFMP